MKTVNHSKKFALVTVAILGIANLAAGARADEAVLGTDRLAVKYADLNLNSAAGAQVLYRRIHTAAHQVCSNLGPRQLEKEAAIKDCMDRAIITSVRAVNKVQLTRTAHAAGYPVQTNLNVASVR